MTGGFIGFYFYFWSGMLWIYSEKFAEDRISKYIFKLN